IGLPPQRLEGVGEGLERLDPALVADPANPAGELALVCADVPHPPNLPMLQKPPAAEVLLLHRPTQPDRTDLVTELAKGPLDPSLRPVGLLGLDDGFVRPGHDAEASARTARVCGRAS